MKRIIIIIACMSLLNCEEVINEENISNDVIQILAPTNEAILKYGEIVSFNWEALAGATEYRVQVATPDFASASQIKLDTLVTRTDFSLDSLPLNNYEWRIKGLNSAYETKYATNGFVVE